LTIHDDSDGCRPIYAAITCTLAVTQQRCVRWRKGSRPSPSVSAMFRSRLQRSTTLPPAPASPATIAGSNRSAGN
jgi:hypothetical protein